MTRTLVDKALALAQKYEERGDTEKRDHFMKVAEEADAVYNKVEVESKQKGGQ